MEKIEKKPSGGRHGLTKEVQKSKHASCEGGDRHDVRNEMVNTKSVCSKLMQLIQKTQDEKRVEGQ